MDFGRVESPEEMVFNLPEDNIETARFFKKTSGGTEAKFFVGCAKWGRKDWIGTLYPKGAKENDFLRLYGNLFGSIELNATFYKVPKKEQVEIWKQAVPDHFIFSPKVSKSISHIKRLKDVKEITDKFCEAIVHFQDKLGHSFLQLDDKFSPKYLNRLVSFLTAFPKGIPLALELRNEEWYREKETFSDLLRLLETTGISFVLTDTAARRDMLHMSLTTPTAFIRFVGTGNHQIDYKRVYEWSERLQFWVKNGLTTVYFYLHEQDEHATPELARYTIDIFNKNLNANLKRLDFILDANSESGSHTNYQSSRAQP